jgi:tRNA A-37 threonylcarbamoyl transferase component Bud32
MVYDINISDWIITPIENFEIRNCLEVNTRKIYNIENVGVATVNFIWINSQISFITNNLNKTEQKLNEAQLNFNLLDRSMRLLEEPFETIFKGNRSEVFDEHTNVQDHGLNIINNNEFEMTEKIEGMISKVTGKEFINPRSANYSLGEYNDND